MINRYSPIVWLTIFLISLSTCLHGQTKVVIPATKLDFNSIQKTKLSKEKLKKAKVSDKWRKKQVKSIDKVLAKNTSIPKADLQNYRVLLSSLDSSSLVQVKNDLSAINELEEPVQTVNGALETKNEISNDFDKRESQARGIKSDWESISKEGINTTNLNTGLPKNLSFQPTTQDSISVNKPTLDSLYLKQYGSDSAENSVSKKLEKYMEKFVAQQVVFQKLEPYKDPTKTLTSPVKQYIPELENFDFEKPTIPKEKLAKALVEQQKDKRINELKQSFKIKDADESYKKSLIDGFEVGGYAQYKSNPQHVIELTPSVAYTFGKKLSLGVGYSTAIKLDKNDSIPITKAWRVFADYVFFKSFFFHAESAWLTRGSATPELPDIRERNTYIGLGRSFGYKFLKTSMLVLYNFNAPTPLQPKKFSFRFGLTISK